MSNLLKILTTLDDELADRCWDVYETCFTPLLPHAMQNQMMKRAEFDTQMLDERIEKLLLLDTAGNVCGLATVTVHLDAVHLLSLPYFQTRWPDLVKKKHIWYVPWVAVTDGHHGAYHTIVMHVWRQATRVDGIVGLDACDYNVVARNFARSIDVVTRRLAAGEGYDPHTVRADSEHYFLYDVNGAHQLDGTPIARQTRRQEATR